MLPQTYIPIILEDTYIHTYLDGGGRQGMPARYLVTSENKVCMLPQICIHTLNIHTYIPLVSRYVCSPRHTYIPVIF